MCVNSGLRRNYFKVASVITPSCPSLTLLSFRSSPSHWVRGISSLRVHLPKADERTGWLAASPVQFYAVSEGLLLTPDLTGQVGAPRECWRQAWGHRWRPRVTNEHYEQLASPTKSELFAVK